MGERLVHLRGSRGAGAVALPDDVPVGEALGSLMRAYGGGGALVSGGRPIRSAGEPR